MIIDKNNFNNQMNNFSKSNNNFNNQPENFNRTIDALNSKYQNPFVEDIKTKSHANPANKKDMSDKTLAMLHQRLESGHITLEEFNKQCAKLGKY